MKKIFNMLMITLCVLGLILTENAIAMEIQFAVGDSHILRGSKKINIQPGLKVLKDDIIITGSSSIVEVVFADGSNLKIYENSKVKIAFVEDGNEKISVIRGIVQTKMNKLMKKSKRKIYSPTTVCAIRGTEFYVAVSDNSNTRVNMKEGKLELKNIYGKQYIEDDEQAKISVAEKPVKDKTITTPEKWQSRENNDFEQDPEKYIQMYNKYIDDLGNKAKQQNKALKKIKNKKGEMIEQKYEEMEDEYLIGATTNQSIDLIMNKFKDTKKDIYDSFYKIKEQSNKVLEQQKANYKAIKAILVEYQKNYKAIKDVYKKSLLKIKPDKNLKNDNSGE